MMLFDPDRYVQEIENTKLIKQIKPPNNKVPPVNLPKLAFDKKIVPIVVSSELIKYCSWTSDLMISLC